MSSATNTDENYLQKMQETIEKNTTTEQPKNPPPQQPVNLLEESDTQLLFCEQERLDQNSPELWPETIPGVNEFTASTLFNSPPKPVLNTVSKPKTSLAFNKNYSTLSEILFS